MTIGKLRSIFNEKCKNRSFKNCDPLRTCLPEMCYTNWLEQQLIELKKPFAVMVEVPEELCDGEGNCLVALTEWAYSEDK
jgi:hypothetical protein